VKNKSNDGKRIQECLEAHKLVDDEIVINLVKTEIDKCEEQHQSWLVAGFPRTKV